MGGKIITEFVAPRTKTCAYLDDESNDHKKAKGIKKCVIKQKLMFKNYKDWLIDSETVYSSQHRFKSYNHDVYIEDVNNIALSANADKRLQTYNKIETYPYGTNAFKLYDSEMLSN